MMSHIWRWAAVGWGVIGVTALVLEGNILLRPDEPPSFDAEFRAAQARLDGECSTEPTCSSALPQLQELMWRHVLSRLDTEIRQTQAHVDELLLKDTDQHPDVIAARDKLEELKRVRGVAENPPLRCHSPFFHGTIAFAPEEWEEVKKGRREAAEEYQKCMKQPGAVDEHEFCWNTAATVLGPQPRAVLLNWCGVN